MAEKMTKQRLETETEQDFGLALSDGTLWTLFCGAYFSATSIPWRIYGNRSHRLLCADYGSLKADECSYLDDKKVVMCTKKNGYWRIVVAEEEGGRKMTKRELE